MNYVKVRGKYFFLIILCFVLFLHFALFINKLNKTFESKQTEKIVDEIFKVKVLQFPLTIKKQIVDSEDSDSHELRANSFLSDETRSFKRQTRSRAVKSFKKTKRSSSHGIITLSHLSGFSEDPLREAAREFARKRIDSSTEEIESSQGQTSDYVPDIPLGDVTYLNTLEYKYYGFYHRIKQKLEQFWGRSLHEKAAQLTRQGRALSNSIDHITSLQITLDLQGEIVRIRILGTSGIKELDDAAIDSFNDAGPFPNPPKGLIQDGKVTLEWGFVVTR